MGAKLAEIHVDENHTKVVYYVYRCDVSELSYANGVNYESCYCFGVEDFDSLIWNPMHRKMIDEIQNYLKINMKK